MITTLAMKVLDFGKLISNYQIYLYSLDDSIPLLNEKYKNGEVSEEYMLMLLSILTKGYGFYFTNDEYIIILEEGFAETNQKELRTLILFLEAGIKRQLERKVVIDEAAFLIYCDLASIDEGAKPEELVKLIKEGHWFSWRSSLKYFKLNLFEKIGVSIAILLYYFSEPVQVRLNNLKVIYKTEG